MNCHRRTLQIMDNAILLNSNSMNQASNPSSVILVGDNQDQEGVLPEEIDFDSLNGDEELLQMADKTLLQLERTLENVAKLQ